MDILHFIGFISNLCNLLEFLIQLTAQKSYSILANCIVSLLFSSGLTSKFSF